MLTEPTIGPPPGTASPAGSSPPAAAPATQFQPPPIPRTALFDEHGALSRAFLLARGRCCHLGCRNCPYEATRCDGCPT